MSSRILVILLAWAALGCSAPPPPPPQASHTPAAPVAAPSPAPTIDVAPLYEEGQLAQAENLLRTAVQADPRHARNQFALGVTLFLRAIERLSQSLVGYGYHSRVFGAVMGLPTPSPCAQAKPCTYADLRSVVEAWVKDLEQAELALAAVDSPEVKLPLDLTAVRLDFNGDGRATDQESLWEAYAWANRGAAKKPKSFVVGLDRADVEWLRGYCHLLTALGELTLAYDEHDQFERCGHLWFKGYQSPYPWLNHQPPQKSEPWNYADISDVIACIHTVNYPVQSPERSRAALAHLQAMSARSRAMWVLIQLEKDNDHEWIPGPRQTPLTVASLITPDMVKGWLVFLDELDSLLAGKKLIPFWREGTTRGVNLNRFFTEPRPFDLVLWLQGTGAQPYLEEGSVTKKETWTRLQRIFGGEFIGFAFWIN